MGIRVDEQTVEIGSYKTLDEGKRDVEKFGGSCCLYCRDYGSGLIADCDPLVEIRKEPRVSDAGY